MEERMSSSQEDERQAQVPLAKTPATIGDDDLGASSVAGARRRHAPHHPEVLDCGGLCCEALPVIGVPLLMVIALALVVTGVLGVLHSKHLSVAKSSGFVVAGLVLGAVTYAWHRSFKAAHAPRPRAVARPSRSRHEEL